MKRYKELKFNDKIYTDQYEINKIIIDNGFEWFIGCEVENVSIEIFKEHLIFNKGVYYNGRWKYGVFRDGEWRYGIWENGVWYNGKWYHGIFESGIIFNGKFLNGKILDGEIRGGDFYKIEIDKKVKMVNQ